MQVPSPASSQSGRMRLLMAQVTSLSDRVASLTAERPGRALSSGARSPASSRTGSAEALLRGAGRPALLPMGPWSPSRGSEPVVPPVGADPRGRAQVAPFSAAGCRLLSPDMHGKGASNGASPPLGPAAGVMRQAEQELAAHAGRGSPTQTLPAQLPHARDDNAPPHDRSAAAARRILDRLGLGYGAGHRAAACHDLVSSERDPRPAGAAEGMQPAASSNPMEGRLHGEQRPYAQLASGAAGPAQGAREGRSGDPLSVVHIFAGQLAARMAADRQPSVMVADFGAAVGGAAVESTEESELRDSRDTVGEPAPHPTAVTPQMCIVGEQRIADPGTASCTAAEVGGDRSAPSLQLHALDRRHGGSHAISDPVPLLLASSAAEHCGPDVQRMEKSASSSPAAAPADEPAAASSGRAAHSVHSKAVVTEALVPPGAPQDAADVGAAAAVAALQGPLPAATGVAEQQRGAIPRLLAWLDAPQPDNTQSSVARVQGPDAAQPHQAQRAVAEEAMRPADCAAHAATDPEAAAAVDPSHTSNPLSASAAGLASVAAACPDPYRYSSATGSPSARRTADGLDEGSGAGGGASPTASRESVQRASHASSAVAACEARHSHGSSVGLGSPGLPASPHAAGSAAAAEDGLGLEHAQGVFLHARAGAGSQGGSAAQPLRSSSSSPAASVAEDEWLQRSSDKPLEAPAAAPASPVAAAAVLPLPGTPDAQRLLTRAQVPAEAAPPALAPGGCVEASCAEVMAGERRSAAAVPDAQEGGADTAACELVCSPAADTAAGSVGSQAGSGGATAGAPHDPHLRTSAAAPPCLSPRLSSCSSPASGVSVTAAAPADACAAVQGAAGEAADSLRGLCPGPDASPAADGSGHASAASSLVHSPLGPATQALPEQHAGLAADGAVSRALHAAASLVDGALADQQARAADTAGTEAAAGRVDALTSPALGRLSAQQADEVAAALLEGLLADATAEIVSAAVQALGDASSADAAARLSLDATFARSPRGWAAPPPEASGVLEKEWPGSGGPAVDSARPRAGVAAAELGAASAAGKAVGREGAAPVPELDLLSTESCAWLRAEDGRVDCAADTPRGEHAPRSCAAECAMRLSAAAGRPAADMLRLFLCDTELGYVIRTDNCLWRNSALWRCSQNTSFQGKALKVAWWLVCRHVLG